MTVPPVVDVQWLQKNQANVKLVAVSSMVPPKPDWKEFKEKKDGKFKELIEEHAAPSELIPDSSYFDFSVAYFPGEFQRFSLYPPELFQEYIRQLGIDFYDHIVVYGSGPASGMLFASRAWWTFKLYGHENVSVLSGGIDAWKSAGLPTAPGIGRVKEGNWKAKPLDHTLLVEYDEIDFGSLDTVNYLDARPREQFTGEQPLGVPAPEATGGHVKGAISVPLAQIMTPNGLKSKDEIVQVLEKAGFKKDRPIISGCLTGVQASLLSLGLAVAGHKARLFNGSMTEVAARNSKLISEK